MTSKQSMASASAQVPTQYHLSPALPVGLVASENVLTISVLRA
ncbi:hypothetical protein [Lampropedia aestuarii]|nr:hypothetical protein [Lampropedia aestuarii]MDH5858504.1 hypothetical protein [Lampropedia aestuarii]